MNFHIICGDALSVLRELPDSFVQTHICSPAYWKQRDYRVVGQMGQEATPELYLERLVEVFREVRRTLRTDGTAWIVIGDKYLNKHRLLLPARMALALQVDGWICRDEIVWHKPRTRPAPMTDRTVPNHEMIYLFSKSPRYYFDFKAIEEPAAYPNQHRKSKTAFRGSESVREIVTGDNRRKRSVWSVLPDTYKEHEATFPADLIRPCVLAGSRPEDLVCDIFTGRGTTGLVAVKLGRKFLGIELNQAYVDMANKRIQEAE